MKPWTPQYFKPEEFGCKCDSCKGVVGKDIWDNVVELALQLDRVRRFFGTKIVIISGARCEAHNKAIGGAKYSMHLKGKGADIGMFGWTGLELRGAFEVLIKQKLIKNGGLGTYSDRPNTLHYDTRTEFSRWKE